MVRLAGPCLFFPFSLRQKVQIAVYPFLGTSYRPLGRLCPHAGRSQFLIQQIPALRSCSLPGLFLCGHGLVGFVLLN